MANTEKLRSITLTVPEDGTTEAGFSAALEAVHTLADSIGLSVGEAAQMLVMVAASNLSQFEDGLEQFDSICDDSAEVYFGFGGDGDEEAEAEDPSCRGCPNADRCPDYVDPKNLLN